MDDAFYKKVKDDLEKSGFTSEMRVIRAFRQSGWTCEGGAAYFDRDERKTREIDAVGSHHVRKEVAKDLFAASWFYVVAEVKSTQTPWVVFREQLSSDPLPAMDAWCNLADCGGFTEMRVELAPGLSEHSLLCELGWRGYSVHECFKAPGKASRWYSAFVSASKAAHHVFGRHTRYQKKREKNADAKLHFPAAFYFVQPVVVLDGQLLSADLDGNGVVVLGEISAAPFEFHFQSKFYRRTQYRVDLVQLDHFAAYLSRCQQRQAHFFREYCELLQAAIGEPLN
jgi:hypothetical protein